MTVSDAVTLFEKFGLEAVAVISPVVALPGRVRRHAYGERDRIAGAGGDAGGARAGEVLTVQVQPPVESARAVAVRPGRQRKGENDGTVDLGGRAGVGHIDRDLVGACRPA